MKILSTTSVTFGKSQADSLSTKKEKTKNISGPIALGLVVASSLLMLVRTDSARIAKITKKGSTKNTAPLKTKAVEIEIKNFKDNKCVKSLNELSGLEKIKEFFNEYQIITSNPEVKKEHNIQNYSSLLFWGVPGTGKTSAAMGIAKEMNADFIRLDKTLFDSEFISRGPRQLTEYFSEIKSYAKTNQNKKIVVFMDEIDSTMAIDRGLEAKQDESLVNALKQGIVDLQEESNIIFIGATNKDPSGLKSDNSTVRLNPAILSRFKYQIELALPNREALSNAWGRLMKTASGKHKFTQQQNDIIAQHFCELGMSYRDMEIIADKLNRLDAVEFCQKRTYNSKENLIKALLNDEKIGYDPVKKQALDSEQLKQIISKLKDSF